MNAVCFSFLRALLNACFVQIPFGFTLLKNEDNSILNPFTALLINNAYEVCENSRIEYMLKIQYQIKMP